jgi:hypothetical protein
LLSPPGVGKSDTVYQAAAEAGLPCRSLLGTQIAPEDVSGIPRIVGERSVFCPPRVLLPETPQPFSTPRSWASLARALDLAETGGVLTPAVRRALARGKVTTRDADSFCRWVERGRTSPIGAELEELLSKTFADLEFSVRATNCLESEGMTTLRDLVVRTEDELLEIRNFGESTFREVKAKLDAVGLSLGMTLSD